MNIDVANSSTPPIYIDRFPLSTLASAVASKPINVIQNRDKRFWASPTRPISDETRDIVEVRFPGVRIINYMSLATARFPHTVIPQWSDSDTGEWQEFTTHNGVNSISLSITDSIPAQVTNRPDAETGHPQHTMAPNHWRQTVWNVKPIRASRVRLVMHRVPGLTPTNLQGQPVPYSLGVRDWQIGYRITSSGDLPITGLGNDDTVSYGSSVDILGGQVVFTTKRDPAVNALLDQTGKFWRSEPQPVSYAVVNYFADLRDEDGHGQTIDRFFLDPLTVGPNLNVYWSNDDLFGDLLPSDIFLDTEDATFNDVEAGSSVLETSPLPEYLTMVGPDSGISIPFDRVQADTSKPWWLGLAYNPQYDSTDTNIHQILSMYGQLFWNNGQVQWVVSDSESYSFDFPDMPVNSDMRAIVGYVPDGPTPTDQDDVNGVISRGFHIFIQMGDAVAIHGVADITHLLPRLGADSEFAIGGVGANANMHLRSFVAKQAVLTPDDVVSFLNDPYDYPLGAVDQDEWPGTAINAFARFHPTGITDDHQYGFVGGLLPNYADLTWTPVTRDFVMKRGYMYFHPVRAKFWKFEMTNLVPEHYEVFVPIKRSVQMFPQVVVQQWLNANPPTGTNSDANGVDYPAGVAVALSQTSKRYSDAVGLLSTLMSSSDSDFGYSPTEALYIADPGQAKKVSQLGWIWNFQPWHIGTSAPKFVSTQKHFYQVVEIDHTTKVGFFAGIKTLRGYRVDYTVPDDTEQYIEHFLDDNNIASGTGYIFDTDSEGNGRVVSQSFVAEIVSEVFESTHDVGSIQFASIQSDPLQVLGDQALVNLGRWSVYGDAVIAQGIQGFHISRGYFHRTYGQIEHDAQYDEYDLLNGRLYGQIEGGQTNGLAGGGINSEAYYPSASGKVYAAARVSSVGAMHAPIAVQLVDRNTNVVLSSTEATLAAGETANIYTTYRVGTVGTPLHYSDMEALGDYGSINGTTYGSHESSTVMGPVFIRVVQIGPTTDQWDLHRVSMYDDPITWEFSVDGGTTWFESGVIRNNVNGVMHLTTQGHQLCYRLRMYGAGAFVSALAIRPWYWGEAGPVLANIGLISHGPNRNVLDHYPPITNDPMWKLWDEPIPKSFYDPPPITQGGAGVGIGPLDAGSIYYLAYGQGIYGFGIYNRPIDPNNPDSDVD